MINPNSPAFPRIDSTTDEPGLPIRAELAARAMQGYLANPNPGSVNSIIKWSVEAADALIAELNKTK